MAAHILTALDQLTDDIKEDRVRWDFIQTALDFSCWTEDLDLFDYSELQEIVNRESIEGLSNWITDKYDLYYGIWLGLGMPTTREKWNKVKFSLRE
jgi:hypothetical protein